MNSIILLGFLIWSFNCNLTRQSNDVLKKDRIYIEAHRGVIEGQKNHNTKEAILNAIDMGVEAFETDVQLTKDNQLVLIHDFGIGIYDCQDIITLPQISKAHEFTYEQLQKCKTIEGGYNIPLLDDIMNITKGKIFMNLELKGKNEKLWDKIQELIEEFDYYDQISISSFKLLDKYIQKIEKYNNDYNRTIVFGFLMWNLFNILTEDIFNLNRTNHQISLNALFLKNNPNFVKDAHDKGMTVGVWFFSEPNNMQYYDLFEIGVDVIITDYPIRVANQLNDYYSHKNYLEGCKSIEKTIYNLSSCISCQIGYELVYINEQRRKLCKLRYEIDSDLYIKEELGVYQEKKIISIKLLNSPFDDYAVCQKNGKTIF